MFRSTSPFSKEGCRSSCEPCFPCSPSSSRQERPGVGAAWFLMIHGKNITWYLPIAAISIHQRGQYVLNIWSLHGHYLTLFSWFSAHGMSAALFKTWIVATASWLEINVYTIWLVYLFFCQIVFGTYRWLDCPVVTWCSFLMMDVKCDLRRLCSSSTVFWPTSIWWRPWWDATFGWVWDFWCNCRCFQLGSALGSSGLSGSRWDTSSPSGYHLSIWSHYVPRVWQMSQGS